MKADVSARVILVVIWFIIIAIPCIGTALVGRKMLNKLAYFPSKTPAIHMSTLGWLMVIEIVAVTLLLTFYRVFQE